MYYASRVIPAVVSGNPGLDFSLVVHSLALGTAKTHRQIWFLFPRPLAGGEDKGEGVGPSRIDAIIPSHPAPIPKID